MKLHVVISGWLLGPPSGANRRLLALAEHAAVRLAPGERITVLHAPSFAPPPLRGVAWAPIAIPAGPSLRRALAERHLLPSALRALGATVLDHGFLPLPPVPVATCLLVHDVRGAAGLGRWPRWVARSVLRRSCARADAVVVPSAWTAARLCELGATRPTPVVVQNGIDLPPLGPSPLPPRSLPPNGYLLHVGHLEPRKNLAVVVRALAMLPPASRPALWLVGRCAGSGPTLQRLAADLSLAPDVHLLGLLPESDLGPLYAHARAVVVPSRHEGFGLCALEGLAHGRPVLASAEGALPEVLAGQGTLLPPHDPAAWAQAIAAIRHDAPQASDARRQRAASFSWTTAADQLVAVWRQLHARGEPR